MRHPLILPTSALALGIALGSHVHPPALALLLTACIFLTITALIRGRRSSSSKSPFIPSTKYIYLTSILLLFVTLGLLLIGPVLNPKIKQNHISNFESNEYKTVMGVVTRPVSRSADSTRIVLGDLMILEENGWVKADGRLRLTVYERVDDIKYGDVVYFRGKIRRPKNFGNPGGFDYEFYLKRMGVSATSSVNGRELIFVAGNVALPAVTKIFEIRRDVGRFMEGALPEEEGAILKALILGERVDIPEDLIEAYRRTGMAHILAISGMHIGILFVISFSILYFVLVRIPRFALRLSVKTLALLLSLVPILFYTLLSGVRITAVRSTLMITAYVISVVVGRDRDVTNTLSLAALIILIFSPASLFDPAFQLSFCAVLSIILIYPILTEPVKERLFKTGEAIPPLWKRLLLRGYQFAAVSLSALVGILPISAYYFFRASPLSLLMNFAVVPLLGFFAVPVSFISLPFIFLAPGVAEYILKAAAMAVTLSNEIIVWVDSLFPGGFMVIPPRLPEIALYYLFVLSAVLFLKKYFERDPKDKSKRRPLPPNVKRRFIFAIITLSIALVILFSFQIYGRYHPRRLTVTFISVGQGDSTLIQFPGEKTMLVDAGGFYGSSFDTGESIVAPYLLNERIRRIDYLVLTHPERDHYGGLEFILTNFEVGRFLLTETGMGSEEIEGLIALSKKRSVPVVPVSEETHDLNINDTVVEFLHPPLMGKMDGDTRPIVTGNLNNSSLVFRVRYGDFTLMMTGDIEVEAEALILSKGGDMESTILKSPHHGSSTSSSPEFLGEVRPEVVVISCGEKSRFGFPGDETLKRYGDYGYVVFRTDVDGAVIVESDGETYTVESINGRNRRGP